MKFRPLHDRVLVKRVESDTKTKGGIIIPDTAQEKPMEGKVISVGSGVRGEDGKIWGSMVKQALKRRKPGFNESYYGFRSFNKLLEEAQTRNLLTLERDEKSGGYIIHVLTQDD